MTFADVERFGKDKAMNTEQKQPRKLRQSGTVIWRQCAVFLAFMFLSATVGGAIGGAIGAGLFGPHPADWGYAAATGFAAGVYLVIQPPLLRFVFDIDAIAAEQADARDRQSCGA